MARRRIGQEQIGIVSSQPALVHGPSDWPSAPEFGGYQVRRTETGLAVLIMRLSVATARAASPC